MDIALKRKKFEFEIRRHNRFVFIKKKKDELTLANKVNDSFEDFISK